MFDVDAGVTLAAKVASQEGKLDSAKDALCAWFVEQGISPDTLKAPKPATKGAALTNSQVAAWRDVKAMAARIVKCGGRKLDAAGLAKYLDDTVSGKMIICGSRKAGVADEGKATWNGNVTSQIGTWRKWLEAYIARGEEPEERAVKSDRAYIAAKITDMVKRLGKITESETLGDGTFTEAAAFLHDLRAITDKYKV